MELSEFNSSGAVVGVSEYLPAPFSLFFSFSDQKDQLKTTWVTFGVIELFNCVVYIIVAELRAKPEPRARNYPIGLRPR